MLLLVLLLLRVQHSREGSLLVRLKRIDWLVNLILMSSVVAVLIALTWGGTLYTWDSW